MRLVVIQSLPNAGTVMWLIRETLPTLTVWVTEVTRSSSQRTVSRSEGIWFPLFAGTQAKSLGVFMSPRTVLISKSGLYKLGCGKTNRHNWLVKLSTNEKGVNKIDTLGGPQTMTTSSVW
jgi:hypothetical protein